MQPNRALAREKYADLTADARKEGEAAVLQAWNRMGRLDLFFLLTHLCHRKDMDRDWLYERCCDVQAAPDGMLDLWAREHYKSTIITYGKSIQDILDSHSPVSLLGWTKEICVGVFSHTRPIAKAFLSQIKMEFEQNELLKQVYPDVLWQNPRQEAAKWSTDNGIIVKRASNPKESTVEAWGLVDGQPTSKHFDILVYDDVVTRESVTTTDQIKKTTDAYELSTNLGTHGGIERMIGTRYHFNDTWKAIMDKGQVTPRIFPATDDGTAKGNPVFLDRATLEQKRKKQGPYTFACQMLQNPKAEDAMGFRKEWLRHYDAHDFQCGRKSWPKTWNYYLLCDPAGEKKKRNDYTVIVVLGLGPDKNYYLVDGVRDRLNLSERTEKMFAFQAKYHISGTGYEKYGKDADIEHIESVMELRNWRFDIKALGGAMPKNDRIRRLVPAFSENRFFLPYKLEFLDYEGKTQDFVKLFEEEEYLTFPVAVHDDMLDCISRIKDPGFSAVFPQTIAAQTARDQREYDPLEYR